MFVSSSVEHILWTVGLEDVLHARMATDGGDDSLGLDVGKAFGHHQADVVLRSLGTVDKHHVRRLEGADLSHDLAAYASCRACDHDTLASKGLSHALKVNAYLIARQQVFNAHLLKRRCSNPVLRFTRLLRVPLLTFRLHVDMDSSCNQLVLQRLVLSKSVFRSLCHKQRINLVALHVLDQMLVRGPHLQAHEHAVHQLWLLRHEPHETQVERLVVAHLLCQPNAAFSHAIDISLSGVKAVERHIVDGLH